ncbi:MAG TPA: ShlB/FhaC/HecB family hemolysin secretion/activation protein, partial [Rhodocyclaceae bacterium]|nr:ShlB/FhaC/HecB family hemolysin secretion/activation protein [Rhodocyclaceae bacterium]
MDSLHCPRPNTIARCLSALFFVGTAAAVQAQPDAGTLLNQEQRSQQRLPDRLPETEVPVVRPALKDTNGAKVVVKSIRFTGAPEFANEQELQAVVANAIGQELDFAGLQLVARKVTDYLRSKGWFLAEAYLPRQDVTDGNIEIAIRAGRLDGKNGKGQPYAIVPGGKLVTRIDPSHLESIAAKHLPAGSTVYEGDMERAVLLMNDLPGISARARLEPGAEEASTRVVVDVEEGPPVTGSTSLDNYGNRDTGLYQLNLAMQINDPLGKGDQVSMMATQADGIDLARAAYSMPVGADGMKLGASWTNLDYAIQRGVGRASGLKGASETMGLNLSYPFLRSRATNIYGLLSYNDKALKDDSKAGLLHKKRVDSWLAAVSGDRLDTLAGGGLTSWNLGWTGGKLDLSAMPDDAALDASEYNTQGRYDKYNYGLGRLQKLPGTFAVFANFSGQTAGKNLDSSEKFLLGGPNGVRAYPGAEGSGDNGWLFNLELRYDVLGGTDWGQLQFI